VPRPSASPSKFTDADWRRWRASYAARARNRPDHHINKLAEATLTDAQIERLRALLPPAAPGTDNNAATPSD
jgi:hypothetical protein